ncbi:MAG: transglycosylase SLT domain-containing protein [Negativicutes bacterium]|nr:transglycosylase SLT domain-containing protein [Negativicutes bacterium]
MIKAANELGVNPRTAVTMAAIESSFRPNAVSSTGATGLGQFTSGTWLDRVRLAEHPELKALKKLSREEQLQHRRDPRLNALALAENMISAEKRIQNAFKLNNINSRVTPADIYALHNIGNPGMSVAARKGQMARTAVSASALKSNSALYIKGSQTTAQEYMKQVNKKLAQAEYNIKHGAPAKR